MHDYIDSYSLYVLIYKNYRQGWILRLMSCVKVNVKEWTQLFHMKWAWRFFHSSIAWGSHRPHHHLHHIHLYPSPESVERWWHMESEGLDPNPRSTSHWKCNHKVNELIDSWCLILCLAHSKWPVSSSGEWDNNTSLTYLSHLLWKTQCYIHIS